MLAGAGNRIAPLIKKLLDAQDRLHPCHQRHLHGHPERQPLRQAQGRIATARFRLLGKGVPPDATFTLTVRRDGETAILTGTAAKLLNIAA